MYGASAHYFGKKWRNVKTVNDVARIFHRPVR